MKNRLNKTFCLRPRRVARNLLPAERMRRRIRLAKILVPIDFSRCSQKALDYALPLAKRFGASITLLHVVEPIVYPMDFGYGPVIRRIPNEALLKKTTARLSLIGKKIAGSPHLAEAIVRTGTANNEIVEVARAREIDLIILGTRGCREVNHLEIGSTAEKVVRHAPCPVFVVRRKEHQFV